MSKKTLETTDSQESQQTSNIKRIQEFLIAYPGYMKRGCDNLSRKLNCTYEEVKQAKKGLKIDSISLVGEVEESVQIPEIIHMPNILIIDIETAPLKAFVWRLWKQDVYIDQIISEWFMISWSAKWLGSPDVYAERLTSEEAVEENDKRIITKLWNLLNDADIVIAHNGDAFDIPKIKTRFLLHGLPPTTFYHQIDTKKVASKEFGFSSNKLDFLAQSFGVGQKIHTEFSLWENCLKGDEEALEQMSVYNTQDVIILEQVYLKLRPYIKGHPNVTLYDEKHPNRCPSCGGMHLYKEDLYYTQVSKFQVYRCQDCGSLSRDRKNIGTRPSNLSLGK